MVNEREQTSTHVVADVYTRVWDFCWTPISFIAGIFLAHEWLPRFAPWIVAARLGRWPQRVHDDELSHEEKEQIETLRRRAPTTCQRNK